MGKLISDLCKITTVGRSNLGHQLLFQTYFLKIQLLIHLTVRYFPVFMFFVFQMELPWFIILQKLFYPLLHQL